MKVKLFNCVASLLMCVFSMSPIKASEHYVLNELDAVITFEQKPLYKTAPRLLVTQALESLPDIEHEVKFLCERNNGYIKDLSYSMLCYTSVESGNFVHVLGEVRHEERLWNYETKLPKDNLANNIILVLEAIFNFTYDKFKNVNTSSASGMSSTRPCKGTAYTKT